MTDELNREEDEVVKDPLTPSEDSEDDEDLKFLDEDFSDTPEESEKTKGDEALATYNAELKKRGLNKNFKSWDDVAKSIKQIDIAFAKKGMEEKQEVVVKKEEVVEKLPSNLSERLMKVEAPNSKFVLDDIKKDFPNEDPYEVWNKFEVYRKEADIRAENERNKERIANPSGNTEGQPEVDETEQKFLNNLPDKYKPKK